MGRRSTTTTNDSPTRQVKVLAARTKLGETYEYTSTWRTDSGFKVGNRFCSPYPSQSYDGGDTGSPLRDHDDQNGIVVGSASARTTTPGLSAVRTISYSPGSFMR